MFLNKNVGLIFQKDTQLMLMDFKYNKIKLVIDTKVFT